MLRKFAPIAGALITLLFIAQPAFADAPSNVPAAPKATGYSAQVATSDGVNLKLRSLPDGGALVLELLPKDTRLEVMGVAVMDSITVNVPVFQTPAPAYASAVTNGAGTGSAPAQVTPSGGSVIGFLDSFDATACAVGGWAFDPARPADSISVQVWRDTTLVGTFPTSLLRTDVNAARNTSGSHGFLVQFDAKSGMFDGRPHQVFVNALNAAGAATPLNASGVTETCQGAVPASSGPVVDLVWFYVSHGVGAGSVRGWVNGRYVQLQDKAGLPISYLKALRQVKAVDPTTRGRAIGVTLQPISNTSGGTADITQAATVYVDNLDPDKHLSIHSQPDVNSDRIAMVGPGTALGVCGRAGDAQGNLWLCVKAPMPDGTTRQGFALAIYLSAGAPGAASAPSAAPQPVTTGQDSAPAVQPNAQTDNSNTGQAVPQATQVAPSSVQITPPPTQAAPGSSTTTGSSPAATPAPTDSAPPINPVNP